MVIPVSLEEAAQQLQLGDDDSRDDELRGFIDDAAAWVEAYTGHLLVARDVTAHFDRFDAITVPGWPIADTAVPMVTYSGVTGNAVTITTVRIDRSRRPARILPWQGSRWPSVQPDSVSVTVRAGYEDDDVVPGNFRRAMLVLIAAYDADREGGDIVEKAEATARRLCRSFRVRRL